MAARDRVAEVRAWGIRGALREWFGRCGNDAKYGVCHRVPLHWGCHATGIGPGFWFGWRRDGSPIGYMHFHRGRAVPVDPTLRDRRVSS